MNNETCNRKRMGIYRKINEVRKLWLDIMCIHNELTIFQTYEWNMFVFKSLRFNRKIKVRFLVFDSKVIVPIEINKYSKTIRILGYSKSSDFLSFIYRDMSFELFVYIIDTIRIKYKAYKFYLDRIHEDNIISEYMNNINIFNSYKTRCVRINVSPSLYFIDSLSKSTKQNIRTAKNRILKNGKMYNISCTNKPLSKKEVLDKLVLYRTRLLRKNDYKLVKLLIVKLMTKCIKNFKMISIDPLSNYSLLYEVYLSEIRIDNEVAAYFEGVVYGATIYILRASTNEKFAYYSPGQILLYEMLTGLDDKISYLDMTRGDEDYKLKFGGSIYFNNNYELY